MLCSWLTGNCRCIRALFQVSVNRTALELKLSSERPPFGGGAGLFGFCHVTENSQPESGFMSQCYLSSLVIHLGPAGVMLLTKLLIKPESCPIFP